MTKCPPPRIGTCPKEIIIEDLSKATNSALNAIDGRLNPFWILLDNQSTVHVFYNTIFLRNIRKVNKELHLYTTMLGCQSLMK